MHSYFFYVVVLSALIASNCGANKDTINADIVNNEVQTSVDLTTHLPKITDTITLENSGKSSVSSFVYAVQPGLGDKLSFISASLKAAGDADSVVLDVAETRVTGQKGRFYRVSLASTLGAGAQVTVTVETAFSHSLLPYPSSITQSEKQHVKFIGSVYMYSPYSTTSQTTVMKCSSSNIESYTRTKPVMTSDNTITYGPYKNLAAFSQSEVEIHYENNSPFLTVTMAERVIEVSHWGNIAVEETVDISHTGAQLKGPFSRIEYQRQQDGASSVKSFKTVLPASARDVYYRDEIGNISTSNLREQDDGVELELKPRFPLFGGWKTHYYMGYNVPSYQYLYNSGDQYVLKMRFVDHIFDDQVIDNFRLKIILPEGASDIDVELPYDAQREADSLHYTYLDTSGRPVVTINKVNLVEQHIQDFKLRYSFPKLYLMREPLMVVGAFYLLFLVIIIYVRMDFSITKDEASESRMRVASLIEQVQILHDRRSALYQSYEDAINKLKTSKDTAQFASSRKRVDADHKALTQQISALQSKLKTEGADVAEKVAELQRLDSQVKEQLSQAISNAERLVASKLTKAQYLEAENNVNAKRDDIVSKMDVLSAAL